jgi:hypothetical protein
VFQRALYASLQDSHEGILFTKLLELLVAERKFVVTNLYETIKENVHCNNVLRMLKFLMQLLMSTFMLDKARL